MTNYVGTKHHSAKMTPAKVRQARKSWEVRDKHGNRKWTISGLARKYGVSHPSMRAILDRKTWAHVS